MIQFLQKWLGKESRESQIHGEIATLDRVAKYGGNSEEGDLRRAALVEELAAMASQCADCNGTRKVGGVPCPACAPTDDGPGDGGGIPISEFAAMSSENAAIVDQLRKGLDDGSISMCACMGPIGDDPYCPCAMRRNGLEPTNLWTPEKIAELHRVLDEYKPRPADNGPEEREEAE